MRKGFVILAACGLVSALAPAAMSACIYSFSTDQPVYDVSGGPVTVRVYLTETLTDGSASFADANDGIAGVQLSVIRTAGDAGQITAVTRNMADFTDSFSSVSFTPTQADVMNILSFTALEGVKFNGAPNTTTNMYQADITIGADGADAATFEVNAFGPEGGYVNTYNGPNLDVSPAGNEYTPIIWSDHATTFQVLVPEPSMLGLIAASGLLLIRRRRSA